MRTVAKCIFQGKNGSLNAMESLNEVRTINENGLHAAFFHSPTQTKQPFLLWRNNYFFHRRKKTQVRYFCRSFSPAILWQCWALTDSKDHNVFIFLCKKKRFVVAEKNRCSSNQKVFLLFHPCNNVSCLFSTFKR